MITRNELKKWLASKSQNSFIAIDEGGLTLVELDENKKPTGHHIEVGGEPTDLERCDGCRKPIEEGTSTPSGRFLCEECMNP